MVEAVPLPEVVDHAILAAYAHLGQGADAPVEVRSSGTAEDTEAASFAGMNETFLNVCGPDAVVDAVRRASPGPHSFSSSAASAFPASARSAKSGT